RHAEALGDVAREQRLAGAGLALDQERSLERDRAVDRVDQRRRGDVALGALELVERLARLRGHGAPSRADRSGTAGTLRDAGPLRKREAIRLCWGLSSRADEQTGGQGSVRLNE